LSEPKLSIRQVLLLVLIALAYLGAMVLYLDWVGPNPY